MTKISLTSDIVKSLLHSPDSWYTKPAKKSVFSPLVTDLLPTINNIKMNYMQLKYSSIAGEKSRNDYGTYLQYPNAQVKALAMSIVKPTETDDEKAHKIMSWVQDNIDYQSDVKTYKMSEFWALPTLTLNKGCGDCEDGAFLIHSLVLNAGISCEKIRTYGGLVVSETNAEAHMWTAYKRDTDDEWVVLDWCYYANKDAIADRKPMKDDIMYIDDYFYVNAVETIETPYTNKVKNPGTIYSVKTVPNFLKGQRINAIA